LIKYIKSVLWRVAKCLSYIEEARCLKVKYSYTNRSLFKLHSWPAQPNYRPNNTRDDGRGKRTDPCPQHVSLSFL